MPKDHGDLRESAADTENLQGSAAVTEEELGVQLRFYSARLRTYSLPVWIGAVLLCMGIGMTIAFGISHGWMILAGILTIWVFLPIRRELLQKLKEIDQKIKQGGSD